jgi:hypothetical protein
VAPDAAEAAADAAVGISYRARRRKFQAQVTICKSVTTTLNKVHLGEYRTREGAYFAVTSAIAWLRDRDVKVRLRCPMPPLPLAPGRGDCEAEVQSRAERCLARWWERSLSRRAQKQNYKQGVAGDGSGDAKSDGNDSGSARSDDGVCVAAGVPVFPDDTKSELSDQRCAVLPCAAAEPAPERFVDEACAALVRFPTQAMDEWTAGGYTHGYCVLPC